MNVKHYLVEKAQFARTLWVHLSVNVLRVQPVTQPSNVQEQLSSNVAQMQIADLEKLVSQANVFAEEDLTLTLRLANVRILTNV